MAGAGAQGAPGIRLCRSPGLGFPGRGARGRRGRDNSSQPGGRGAGRRELAAFPRRREPCSTRGTMTWGLRRSLPLLPLLLLLLCLAARPAARASQVSGAGRGCSFSCGARAVRRHLPVWLCPSASRGTGVPQGPGDASWGCWGGLFPLFPLARSRKLKACKCIVCSQPLKASFPASGNL